MPKAKPTQVITHRIELGAWERENLGKPVAETAQSASMISSIGVAGVGVAAIGATYAVWKLWGVFEYAKEKVMAASDVIETGATIGINNSALGRPWRTISAIFSL